MRSPPPTSGRGPGGGALQRMLVVARASDEGRSSHTPTPDPSQKWEGSNSDPITVTQFPGLRLPAAPPT